LCCDCVSASSEKKFGDKRRKENKVNTTTVQVGCLDEEVIPEEDLEEVVAVEVEVVEDKAAVTTTLRESLIHIHQVMERSMPLIHQWYRRSR